MKKHENENYMAVLRYLQKVVDIDTSTMDELEENSHVMDNLDTMWDELTRDKETP